MTIVSPAYFQLDTSHISQLSVSTGDLKIESNNQHARVVFFFYFVRN